MPPSDRQQRDRRAEVRLARDEEEWQEQHCAGDREVAAAQRRELVLTEPRGEQQRERGLGELGRLQVEDDQ